MVQVAIIIIGLFLTFKPGSISLSAQRELVGGRKIAAGIVSLIIAGLVSVLEEGMFTSIIPFVALLILVPALSTAKVGVNIPQTPTTQKISTIIGGILLAALLAGALWLAYMVSMGK
jgi:hypothetical protein